MTETPERQAERGIEVMRDLSQQVDRLRKELVQNTDELAGLRDDLAKLKTAIAKQLAAGAAGSMLGKLFGGR